MNESKKKKKITCMEDVRTLPKQEQIKYEIAEELGVVDKVFESGWRSLSARESGRIGGIIRSRKAHQNTSPLPDGSYTVAKTSSDNEKE